MGQSRALAGFAVGLIANLLTWVLLPGVSWLWWNMIGCVVALAVALLPGGLSAGLEARPGAGSIRSLLGMAVVILGVCVGFQLL